MLLFFRYKIRMKGFKCTKETRILAMVLFTLYFLYGMVKIPLLEYIVCLSVGAVIYGITQSIEFGVLGLLIANLILPMFRSSKEGFTSSPSSKEAESPSSKEDAPLSSLEPSDNDDSTGDAQASVSKPQVSGIVETDAADSSGVDSATQSVASSSGLRPDSQQFSKTSTPASAKTKPATAKRISEKDVPPANQPADLITDGFEDKNGLFKLGKIPTDEKGGFHIDAGTSVLNALKSLKPDQISAMTQDTKQLIETQKTLMNMLQSFKPMMSEGKEMMDTFQQMFSSNGSAMGALQTAQDTLKK